MSYFRVMPNTLRAQREELETAYRDLCQDISEIGGVIRQLSTMTSFDGPIKALRQTQRKGSEQQAKLRQCASVLGNVADLYEHEERRNLEGDGTGSSGYYYITPVRSEIKIGEFVRYNGASETGGDEYYVLRKYEIAAAPAVWQPCTMVLNPEDCFGMKVVTLQEK